MKLHFAFILVLVAVLANGCKEDEIVTPPFDYPEYFDCDYDIRQYDLLPSSLTYSPYGGKSSVFFIDSLGTLLEFTIDTFGPKHISSVAFKYDVVSVGDTVRYCYRSEQLRFTLVTDSMDIQFDPAIKALPYFTQPEPGIQYDYFDIRFKHPMSDPDHSTQVYSKVIDPRTAPVNNIITSIEVPNYEVFGHTYHDVETTTLLHPVSKIYFNRTEGIVSFTDGTGKTWRFDHFE